MNYSLKAAAFFAGQLAIQGLSVVTGLVIVNAVSRDAYAHYTLVLAVTTALQTIATGGLCSAVSALSGSSSGSSDDLKGIYQSGLHVYYRLWLLALFPIYIATALLTGGVKSIDAVMAQVLAVYAAVLSGHVVIAKFSHKFQSLHYSLFIVDLFGALIRILPLAAFWIMGPLIAIPFAASALASRIQIAILGAKTEFPRVLQKIPQTSQTDYILSCFWRQLPNALYAIASNQIGMWFLVIAGYGNEVADFGALSRISIIFGSLATTIDVYVFPKFSRISTQRKCVMFIAYVMLSYAALMTGFYISAALLSDKIVWLLGPQYAHLSDAVPAFAMAAAANAAAGTLWNLNMSKGWIAPFYLVVVMTLGPQICTLLLIQADGVKQAISLTIATAAGGALLSLLYAAYSIRKMPE